MDIQTKYSNGDAVYRASAYGIDKQLIQAIRITGNKRQKVEYGFKSRANYFFHMGDDYSWYTDKDLFTDEEKALKASDNLKQLREAKEAKEKADALAKRKAEIEKELKLLEQGIEPDEDEDY